MHTLWRVVQSIQAAAEQAHVRIVTGDTKVLAHNFFKLFLYSGGIDTFMRAIAMLFRQLFDPESSTYTYLIADTHLREAVLVDSVLTQVDRDLKLLCELGLTLRYCLETHIHADHITGAERLREATGCERVVPAHAHVSCTTRYIDDGELLTLGDVLIEAIATPGHTDSHMAYLVDGDRAIADWSIRLLTGDALLIRGCGRTDLQGGKAEILYDSVTQKLFTLPEDIQVYPGHDYHGHTASTIGEEKQWNPRFAGRSREAFVKFMNSLKRRCCTNRGYERGR